MNYSELSDFEINKAVAIACGYAEENCEFGWSGKPDVGVEWNEETGYPTKSFNYCNSWADAGPIIEANKIAMIPESDGTWFALGNPQIKSNWRVESTGAFHNDTTPLRAAMIVFLMMRDAGNA